MRLEPRIRHHRQDCLGIACKLGWERLINGLLLSESGCTSRA
jgi:hypothetical protein